MTLDDFDMSDLEGYESFREIGKMGLSIYRTIIRDGGTENEAFSVTAAFFAGTVKGLQSDSGEDNEN